MESDSLYKISVENERKSNEFFKCVKKASELTHTVILARYKSKKALDAIEKQSKEEKWDVLQRYMKEYASFIRNTTILTGIYLQSVDADFYNTLTLNDLNNALRILIRFVYFREVVNSEAKSTYRGCLKKLLKRTGLFDNSVLDLL